MKGKKPSIITLIIVIVILVYFKNRYSFTVSDLNNMIKGNPNVELIIDNYEGALFKAILNNKTNYIDTLGRIIIKTDYDKRAGNFYCNRAIVFHGDKYGYINNKGELIIAHKYIKQPNTMDFSGRHNFSDNHAFVYDGEFFVFINNFGEAIFKINELPVLWPPNDSCIIIGNLSERGVIDYHGNIIIEPKYLFIRDLSEGLFAVQTTSGVWGFIDKEETLVIDTTFQNVKSFKDGLAAIKLNDKWGFINKKGEIIIEPKYDNANSFYDELAKVVVEDKYGYIKKNDELAIPINFDEKASLNESNNFNNGLALFNENDRFGWIDKKGNIKIAPTYKLAFDFVNGLAYVSDEIGLNRDINNFSYINTNGEIVYQNVK